MKRERLIKIKRFVVIAVVWILVLFFLLRGALLFCSAFLSFNIGVSIIGIVYLAVVAVLLRVDINRNIKENRYKKVSTKGINTRIILALILVIAPVFIGSIMMISSGICDSDYYCGAPDVRAFVGALIVALSMQGLILTSLSIAKKQIKPIHLAWTPTIAIILYLILLVIYYIDR